MEIEEKRGGGEISEERSQDRKKEREIMTGKDKSGRRK